MHSFITVVRYELRRYFYSPLAYVYLLAFLLLNASMTLYLENFLERGVASLDVMFSLLPWIYLIFLSGIAMRLWAEEFKAKTIVQIMTLPLSSSTLVWGKFCAAWLFCTLSLILTFPFVITVNILGTPDNAVIFSGYLACFLLSGAMLSVAQTMSALTKNAVIALVLSVIVNLLFFLSGMEYVLVFFRGFLPDILVDNIAGLSFLSHFGDICNGKIGLWDVLFFILVICIFNFMTTTVIQLKTSGVSDFFRIDTRKGLITLLVLAWLGFAGLSMLSSNLLQTWRVDTTHDKLFTLSEAEKDILRHINEPVTLKVYYSPILSQRNPLYRRAKGYLSVLLKNYQNIAGDKFSYRFYAPTLLNRDEDLAIADKINAIPLPDLNQSAYFGIGIVDESGKSRVIPYIPLENLDRLNQDIIQSIYELSHTKKTVGILSSLPLYGQILDKKQIVPKWAIVQEIEKTYRVKQIQRPEDLSGIDVLMIVHPQKLSQEMIQALAQYTIRHGRLLIFLDTAAEAKRLYSPINERFSPSDLSGLELLWGFRYTPQTVVADLQNSLTVDVGSSTRKSFVQDVIQFRVPPQGLNRQEVTTKELSSLLFASVMPIEHLAGHESTFIPLIQSSSESALFDAQVVHDNVNPADILPQFVSDNTPKTLAAKIISTNLKSPFEVIVVGDSDLMYDDFWSRYKTLEDNNYRVYLNDNANFILNALDDLSSQKALSGLRHSHTFIPRFDKWENLRKRNAVKISVQERELLSKINDTKEELNNLWQKRNFEERQDFSDDELEIIAQFRKSLEGFKLDLANLHSNLSANLDHQKALAVFINLYAVPLLLVLLISWYLWKKRVKKKYNLKRPFVLNKKGKIGGFICLVLFGAGLLVVMSAGYRRLDFENSLVFPDWKNQLNQIQRIEFDKNGQTLTFYQENGFWKIKGFEDYAFYQRRITNFLATLADARYLEKKSARAQYLPSFGLDAANATSIKLKDAQNNVLENFEIGKYQVEIGRGGRAAYLKFSNRFQVWLIDADILSLSTNWRDWVLNTALNARFGRILKTDKISDDDVLLVLLKELLNTPLTIATEKPDAPQKIADIHLTFENNDDMTIFFEQKGGKSYIHYVFGKTDGDYLHLFATYAQDKYYEIPTKNMEKIKDVFSSLGQTNK